MGMWHKQPQAIRILPLPCGQHLNDEALAVTLTLHGRGVYNIKKYKSVRNQNCLRSMSVHALMRPAVSSSLLILSSNNPT